MNLDEMTREELIGHIMQLQSNINNLESRLIILENAEKHRILEEVKKVPLGPMEVPPVSPSHTYPGTGNPPYLQSPGYITRQTT